MSRDKILIVDDIAVNREILVEILREDYDLIEAKDGIEAVEKVMHNSHDLSLVLLDIMMPEMDGYEVLETLTKGGYTNKIPIIVITAMGGKENEVKGLELGAVDYVTKPFFPQSVLARVQLQLELRKLRKHLEKMVNLNVQKVVNMRESMVDFMSSVIEYREIEAGEHVKRTRLMAQNFLDLIEASHKMDAEMSTVNKEMLIKAVSMHDIGKIAIPDSILLKPAKLDSKEFEIIKEHTVKGAKMLNNSVNLQDEEYMKISHDICLYHHERWDGSGYPYGLAGTKIPFAARLMAIIDVYDALTSRRVYKEKLSHEQSIEVMKKGSGTQFDPVMLEIFLHHQEEFQKISSDPALS